MISEAGGEIQVSHQVAQNFTYEAEETVEVVDQGEKMARVKDSQPSLKFPIPSQARLVSLFQITIN